MALRRLLLLAAAMTVVSVGAMASPSQASAACSAINFGAAPTAATIGAAGETDCYTFSGAAVDEIRIRVVETSGMLVTSTAVARPNATSVCTATTVSEFTCSLDVAGTHTINVKDNGGTNTGGYSIAIQRLNNPVGCTALTFGAAPTTASIAAAAEMDCFSFTGAVGDEIRFRAVRTTGSLSQLEDFVRPDGTSMCGASGSQELTCSIDTAGTHRVIFRDNAGTGTGDYAAEVQRLNNPTGCTAVAFGAAPTAAGIGAAGEWDCYSFTGAPGDQIRIRLFETSGSLTALQEVISPDGTTLCGTTTASELTCSPETSGQHRILVRDSNGTNTGNYSLAVQALNNPTGCTALTLGAAPTTASIGAPAEMDCFSFAGAPGRKMRVRVVKTSGTLNPLYEVVDADGATVCGPTGSQDLTCTLETSGAHRILVDDNSGTSTADYSVGVQKLNNPTGCTALTFGAAPTTAGIGAAGEMDCFSFAGSPGDRIRVRLSETSGSLVALQEVVAPHGLTQCAATTAMEMTCTVESSGQHRLIVRDNNGTNTGNYAVAVQALNKPTGCTALTFGAAPTAAGIAAAGEMDCFTFAGSAGDRIRVRMITTSGTLLAVEEVVRPSGNTLCGATGAQDSTCTLTGSGTHTIVVHDNSGNNTGNYTIAIQRLNNPTDCTSGSPQPRGALIRPGAAASRWSR